MTAQPMWQTWLFAFAAIVTITASLILEPNLIVQLLMLAPTVAILGLPHGALDLPIAQTLWPLDGWRGMLRFAFLYVGLGLLVIGFWIMLPGPALFAFLVYSGVHFSGDWKDAGSTLRLAGGVATVGAPALLRQEEVAAIFSYLAPESAANLAALLLAIAGGAAFVVYVAITILRPRFRTRAAVEQAIIWVSAACLAPLVYFIIYFCTLHSVRHFTDALVSLDHQHRALRVAALLSAVTVLAGLVGFAMMQKSGTDILEESILQIVFIGLAALTIPHMILVDRFQYQATRQRSKV